jgi:hypothetical protein
MVYFNQRPATPKTVAEAEQWCQVLAFKEHFPKEGLWWPYRGKADFERKVRHHLTRFIQQEVPRETGSGNTPSPSSGTSTRLQGSGSVAQGADTTAAGERGVAVGHNVQDSIIVTGDHATVTVQPSGLPGPSAQAYQRYLTHLRRVCQALPLASLGSDPSAEQQDHTLDDVYIDLHTTTQVPIKRHRRHRQALPEREAETRPLTALEAFTQSGLLLRGQAHCSASCAVARSGTIISTYAAPLATGTTRVTSTTTPVCVWSWRGVHISAPELPGGVRYSSSGPR